MKKGFLNIILYLFFPAIITSLFYTLLNVNNITYFIFTTTPYLLLCYYFIYNYKNIFIDDFKKINKKNLLITIGIWLLGFILMIFANYIINYIIFDNAISSNEEINRNLLINHKITYSLLMCIIIPFLEEVSFRLEFKKNIKNNIVFILLSSTIFGLIHLINITSIIELVYFIPYFILGLTFSFIFKKTDSIYMNIFAHMLHNTICVIIILFL